jgi:hypothetical protein
MFSFVNILLHVGPDWLQPVFPAERQSSVNMQACERRSGRMSTLVCMCVYVCVFVQCLYLQRSDWAYACAQLHTGVCLCVCVCVCV